LPLPLPNLDDRAWQDLVEEGRFLIPAWSPDWTNYNPSDPGITLIELFAYLSEILMFRLNLIGDANMTEFLQLIGGPDWKLKGDLQQAKRDTLIDYRKLDRAVNPSDFEILTLGVNDTLDASFERRIGRVSCIPGRNLRREWDGAAPDDSSADVTVVVLSDAGGAPNQPLLQKVEETLEPARLLTVRLHVLGPRFVKIGVRVTLQLQRHANAESVRDRAVKVLRDFFDPMHGGLDRRGWPWGRDVYVSELYQLLANLEGVDQVMPTIEPRSGNPLPEIYVGEAEQRRVLRNGLNEVEAIDLGPGELVQAQIESGDIAIAVLGR
jgi:hypothetical protein